MSRITRPFVPDNFPASEYHDVLEDFEGPRELPIVLAPGSARFLIIKRALQLAEWIEKHRDSFRADPAHNANARGMLEMLRMLREEKDPPAKTLTGTEIRQRPDPMATQIGKMQDAQDELNKAMGRAIIDNINTVETNNDTPKS